jgi:hypothetical protein
LDPDLHLSEKLDPDPQPWFRKIKLGPCVPNLESGPFKLVDALPGERVPLLEMDAANGQVCQPFLASVFGLLLTHLHQNLAG